MVRCFQNARGLLLLLGAVAVAGYLVIWHGQHLAAALPVLLLLSCPLMHLFMHGGHGGHGGHSRHESATKAAHPDEGPKRT